MQDFFKGLNLHIQDNIPYATEKSKMSNGSVDIETIIKQGYANLNGGSDVVKWQGSPVDFINNSFSGCSIYKKIYASQSTDFAMLFRLITFEGSRFTSSIRTGGYINLRLRSADGVVQRELQTSLVPQLNENIYSCYSWNADTKVLCLKVVSDENDYGSFSSSASASLPAYTGETSGIYFGNSDSGAYPYKGKMYGGTFVLGKALSMTELEDAAAHKLLVPGLTFQCFPKIYGTEGSTTVRENHGKDLTVSVSDISAFWAS
jgi:hypothetical protein